MLKDIKDAHSKKKNATMADHLEQQQPNHHERQYPTYKRDSPKAKPPRR
jgi:hypothetical protein